jgi:hypothetical protein
MRQRLDRGVATNSWSLLHPGAVLQHLGYIRSDHMSILLDTEYQPLAGQPKSGPKIFKAKWLNENNFREIMQQAWESRSHEIPEGNVLGA